MYQKKNVPNAAKQFDKKESGEHSDIPVQALIRDLSDARVMFYLRCKARGYYGDNFFVIDQ